MLLIGAQHGLDPLLALSCVFGVSVAIAPFQLFLQLQRVQRFTPLYQLDLNDQRLDSHSVMLEPVAVETLVAEQPVQRVEELRVPYGDAKLDVAEVPWALSKAKTARAAVPGPHRRRSHFRRIEPPCIQFPSWS